jgi:hypothetical protein
LSSRSAYPSGKRVSRAASRPGPGLHNRRYGQALQVGCSHQMVSRLSFPRPHLTWPELCPRRWGCPLVRRLSHQMPLRHTSQCLSTLSMSRQQQQGPHTWVLEAKPPKVSNRKVHPRTAFRAAPPAKAATLHMACMGNNSAMCALLLWTLCSSCQSAGFAASALVQQQQQQWWWWSEPGPSLSSHTQPIISITSVRAATGQPACRQRPVQE